MMMEEEYYPSHNCPLDKDELGRATWCLLHTMAAYYPEQPSQQTRDEMLVFISNFSKVYPCHSCAAHFRELLMVYPPQADSRVQLTQWFCKVHNEVNRRLGKPLFDCRRVDERWRDGWRDGSCD